jgi:hypothetical protein
MPPFLLFSKSFIMTRSTYCKSLKKTCKRFSDTVSWVINNFCYNFAPYAKFILGYYFYISFLKAFFELSIQNFVYLIHLIVGPIGPSLTFLVLTMTFSFFLFLVSKGLTTFVKTDEQLQGILRFLTPDLTTLVLGSISYLAATVFHFSETSRKLYSPKGSRFASVYKQVLIYRQKTVSKAAAFCAAVWEPCSFFPSDQAHRVSKEMQKPRGSEAVVEVSQKATFKVIFYVSIINLIAMLFLVQITLVSPAFAMENPFEPVEQKQTQVEVSLNEKVVTNDNDSTLRKDRESSGEPLDGSKRKFSEEDASKVGETGLFAKKAKEKEYRMAKMAKLNGYSPVDIQLRALVREARKSVGINPTRLENNASKIYEDTLKKAKLTLETGSSQLESRSAAETNRRLIAYAKQAGTGRNTFLDAIRRERIAKIDEVEVFTAEQVLAHHEKNLKTLLAQEEFKNPTDFSSRYGESLMFKQLQAYVKKKPDLFDLMPDSYFNVQPKNDLALPSVGLPLVGVEGSSSACASGIDPNLANSGVATAFDLNTANTQSILPLNEHMLVNDDFSESDAATMAAQFFDLPLLR